MSTKITDFFTKNNNEFKDSINVYVCGPTVYNHAHIGNVRPVVTFDILNRINNLNYVHNITDIDDKIINKAKEEGKTEKEISEFYTEEYLKLLSSLNIKLPNEMPKVTENIEGMISFISELIEKGFAYESNGSVYFSVKNLASYGIYANVILDTLIDEEESEDKKEQKDFAIWKSTGEGIKFQSPWGEGRPGWHTECSYFILKYFGDEGIDIHGGGIDLKFPHHVNEMAQYEAYNGKPSENTWLYVGHVNIAEEKMSKSKGNVILAKDFINEYGYDVLRHILLSTHYLKPITVNEDSITNSVNTVNKIKNALVKAIIELGNDYVHNPTPTQESISSLKDDLNTSEVFTRIFKDVKTLNNKETERKVKQESVNNILGDLSLLGIEYKVNIIELAQKILDATTTKDYEALDKLKEGVLIC